MNGLDAYTTAFFDQLVVSGVTDVVLSPGSRSAPLAAAAHRAPGLTVWVQHDERVGGFFALGMAKALRRPVAVICTSGTAAANYHPSVVEADHSNVALLVMTADRPLELRNWGANQTTDQVSLFGSSTRMFAEMPIATEVQPEHAAHMAAKAVARARGTNPGPVHLNWPFRKPLEPDGSTHQTRPVSVQEATFEPQPGQIETLSEAADRHERGVIVVGPVLPDPVLTQAIVSFADQVGWPILADPMSQLRFGSHIDKTPTIGAYDLLLGSEAFRERFVPDIVVQLGATITSKHVPAWLAKHRPRHIMIGTDQRWRDPHHSTTDVLLADPSRLLTSVESTGRAQSNWSSEWLSSASQVEALLEKLVSHGPLTEALVSRLVVTSLPDSGAWHLGSSMPIRDVDAFAAPTTKNLAIFGNRGASGIDGAIATAAGEAAGRAGPMTLLSGDIAFIHDIGGLLAAARLGIDLTVVVLNNDGGAIFSMLPIAEFGEDVGFDQLFRTPHGMEFGQLAEACGAAYHLARDSSEVTDALASPADGVVVVEVPIENKTALAQWAEVRAAVAELGR